MMDCRVYWTPMALRSLHVMHDFVSRRWDGQVVDLLLSSIEETLERISQFPAIAPVIEGTDFRKYVLHKYVSLFYSHDLEVIKVLLIWDNRMDDKDLFDQLSRSVEE